MLIKVSTISAGKWSSFVLFLLPGEDILIESQQSGKFAGNKFFFFRLIDQMERNG